MAYPRFALCPQGALQDVRIIPGPHGYLHQCPQLDTSCPTCGQFSQLQNTVDQLERRLLQLSERVSTSLLPFLHSFA